MGLFATFAPLWDLPFKKVESKKGSAHWIHDELEYLLWGMLKVILLGSYKNPFNMHQVNTSKADHIQSKMSNGQHIYSSPLYPLYV